METRYLGLTFVAMSILDFMYVCAPLFMGILSFSTFVYLSPENTLTAQVAFVSLGLFNVMRIPLTLMPLVIRMMLQIVISAKRSFERKQF
jgi:hypothetical protein